VADLNTKILSADCRNYHEKIGFLFPLWQDSNNHEEPYGQARMVQNVVRAAMAVMMTNLQGCDHGRDLATTWTSMWTWFGTISFPMTSFISILVSLLFLVITYLVLKVNKLSKELAKYKMVWEEIRKTMNLQPRADPFVNNGESDGERHEGGETESETADVEIQDAEAPQLPLRGIAVGACHGAANNLPDDDEGDGHRRADPFGDGTRSRSPRSSTARGSTDAEVPVPKPMPKPLAKAVARNQAMHVSDVITNMMACASCCAE
jgi:hypothetical protein